MSLVGSRSEGSSHRNKPKSSWFGPPLKGACGPPDLGCIPSPGPKGTPPSVDADLPRPRHSRPAAPRHPPKPIFEDNPEGSPGSPIPNPVEPTTTSCCCANKKRLGKRLVHRRSLGAKIHWKSQVPACPSPPKARPIPHKSVRRRSQPHGRPHRKPWNPSKLGWIPCDRGFESPSLPYSWGGFGRPPKSITKNN
jgi:hypothetical protein